MNARAGKFKFTPNVDGMRNLIKHLDLDIEVVGTESHDHMIRLLKELAAKGVERVAVAGGDGTVSSAIQVIAETKTALGIIPQGTANNVATALRIPLDIPSSLRVLQEGQIIDMDLGRACGRFFAETAGVGLFADALGLYGREANKNPFRSLYAVGRIIANLRAHRVALTIDGERMEEPSVFCVAANTFRMAHSLAIAPSAKVTDGELDVVIFGDLHRNELFTYYRALRSQLHITLPKVRIVKAKEVLIETRRRMLVHCDDKVPCATPVTISAAPRALKAIVERL